MTTQTLSRGEILKQLRTTHAESVKRAQALLKEQKHIQQEVCKVLRERPKTVPEVATETGIPMQQVLWYMASFKKVWTWSVENGMCGDYPLYQKAEENKSMNRVDPTLLYELKEYGAVGIEKCFNCGNCTAVCPLASSDYAFPRSVIRRVQIGQKEHLKTQLDPWLCYYCGDCSATCPKDAEPGETMMAARRWLTAQYDWTGLARKFYTSKVWEIGSVLLLSCLSFC